MTACEFWELENVVGSYPSRGLMAPGKYSPKDNLLILWLIWTHKQQSIFKQEQSHRYKL